MLTKFTMNHDYIQQNHSKNETIEHFTLKEIARLWLYTKGCRAIATEVGMKPSGCEGFNKKMISDVVGIYYQGARWKSTGIEYKDKPIYNIEAKASKQDYNNGFNISGNFNYVIIPKGMIDKNEVPSPCGLIEVDLELTQTNIKEAIKVTKRATRVGLTEPFVYIEKRINQRMTNELIYNNNCYLK